jgi:hypothetical protein
MQYETFVFGCKSLGVAIFKKKHHNDNDKRNRHIITTVRFNPDDWG